MIEVANGLPIHYHLVEVFIHNRKVGEYLQYAQCINPTTRGLIQHEALFCPTCGDIWGRKYIHPAEGWPRDPEWSVTTRPCERHYGGLLLSDTELDYPPAHLVSFGKRILAHDFILLMEELR